MHLVDGPDGVREPGAVIARLGAGRAQPVAAVVLRVTRIAQPARFVELVAGGATDRPVRARPEWPVDELGVRIAAGWRTVGEVFRGQFPPVVVGRRNLGIRALEKRDVLPIPVPVAIVPEGLGFELGLLVENRGRVGRRIREDGECAQGQTGERVHDRFHVWFWQSKREQAHQASRWRKAAEAALIAQGLDLLAQGGRIERGLEPVEWPGAKLRWWVLEPGGQAFRGGRQLRWAGPHQP